MREQVAAHTTPHRVYISGRGVVWVVIFCPAYPMGHLGTRGGQQPVTSQAVTLVFGWIYINLYRYMIFYNENDDYIKINNNDVNV